MYEVSRYIASQPQILVEKVDRFTALGAVLI
jgi:hypothetical protein